MSAFISHHLAKIRHSNSTPADPNQLHSTHRDISGSVIMKGLPGAHKYCLLSQEDSQPLLFFGYDLIGVRQLLITDFPLSSNRFPDSTQSLGIHDARYPRYPRRH